MKVTMQQCLDGVNQMHVNKFARFSMVNNVFSLLQDDITNLKFAVVKTITNEKCTETNGFIEKGVICAYSGKIGIGACNGDSTGPLTLDGKLIGIMSWVKKVNETCAGGKPDGYVRISEYVQWINKNMKEIN